MKVHALGLPPTSDLEYEFAAPGAAHTVVLGYDGSPSSRAAVRRAAELAGPGGRLVAVRASNGTRPEDPFSGLEPEALDGAHLETRVVEGDAADALAAAALECDAEHVVIGWDESDPGRVCAALMERGSGPVTVVPGGRPPIS